MGNINCEQKKDTLPVEEQAVEFVERKGMGHPDSLIDGIVENLSLTLDKYYVDKFGSVLHHNVDKGLIVGGAASVDFGKGTITKPIEIIIAGRATDSFKGVKIPVENIAIESTREYLEGHTRFLDVDREVKIVSKVFMGSLDLNQIFLRNTEVPLANDTSFGIGFAPFTETEKITYETEKFLNSPAYKKKMPMVGEDIKVMGVREGNKITLTVAIAFVTQFIKNVDEYLDFKSKVVKDVKQLSKKFTKREVEVVVNNGDAPERNDVYITKSGLSCEAGDDGAVGRGNRVNGLITPFRHMTLEAAAGKNPINHVGKIYSILSNEIAADVIKEYPSVRECTVSIVSQIGRKINDPRSLYIDIIMDNGEKFDPIRSKVMGVAQNRLDNILAVTKGLSEGKYDMF